MLTRERIVALAEKRGRITTTELAASFSVSRQYVNLLIHGMVERGELIKIGGTRYAFYVLPDYARIHPELASTRFVKSFVNEKLEEHVVLARIGEMFPPILKLPENIRSIFTFAFSEMLKNAIEHSGSVRIGVEVSVLKRTLSFVIEDSGVGVFRNVMRRRGLASELEAIQDILKGKTTTMPKSHSGEGIFFTSKSGDVFVLDSYGYQLIVDNTIPDVFIKTVKKQKRGTRVSFQVALDSDCHLQEVFNRYANISDKSDYGFDKTEIRVKLYAIGGVHISRSQARRVLTGLEKFKIVLFDFENVPTVGQAFADEVFRVFHHKHPEIRLEAEHMEAGVKFMIERARNEADASF